MAEELDKRMDELLKTYADKRRQEAGAPFELHPATRKLLEGEVARTYPQAPASSWLHRVLLIWPRLAFAGATVVIMLTLVLMFLPEQKFAEMAQNKTEPLARDARAVSDNEGLPQVALLDALENQPMPAPSTEPVAPGKKLDALAKRNEADAAKPALESLEARKDVLLMREQPQERPNNDEMSPRYFANTRSVALKEKQDDRFAARTVQAQNLQPILNNFQFEQAGKNVKITDEDGSVYAGRMLSEEEVKREVTQTGLAGAAPQAPEAQLFFRASGTNRSLRQKVSIEANVLQLPTNSLSGVASDAKVNQPRTPAQQPQMQQQTIRGRARVGNNQEFEIEAVPAQKP